MRRSLLLLLLCPLLSGAQVPLRVPNTSLHFPEAAPSADPYVSELALSETFSRPLVITSVPGETNRLFVADQYTGIYVVPDLANPVKELFLDLSGRIHTGTEEGVLGLAFHPAYASNGYFYVFLTGTASTSAAGKHDRLLRYQVSATNAQRGVLASEQILFEQYSPNVNHNAGDLHFGPEGYLYVALGDGGGYERSAIDGNFHTGLLRIDVDKRPGSLVPKPHPGGSTNYHIPLDNPFVGATNFQGLAVNTNALREEFWATGFRNPWRFSIDPVTGQILLGDVGEVDWEELNFIVKGQDYGWVFREGPEVHVAPGNPPLPPDFNPVKPLVSLPHPDNLCIIGGVVYRGARLPELQGVYVYSDWQDAQLWGVVPDGTNSVLPIRLAQLAGFSTVCYGVDPRNGDLLFNRGGQIHRLIPNPGGAQFPLTLEDTGAFSDLASLTPADGVLPFDINVRFWSDHADKTRWFSIPAMTNTLGYTPTNFFELPEGAVWIKHFELNMERENPATARRIETRFIVKTSNDVYGLTYRWQNGTQAVLVGESGFSEDFLIQEGTQTVSQTWSYPARSDCRACHTPEGGFVLGFSAPQLSRMKTYGSIQTNQLLALHHMGYFSNTVSQVNEVLPLSPADDANASLTWRARSYFQANCAGCHRYGGFSSWQAAIHHALDDANIINGTLNNLRGDAANRVIAPGDAAHSMILSRINTLQPFRMPPLGSSVIDTQAVQLVTDWISELTGYQDYWTWALAEFGSTNAPGTGPNENFDSDPANNLYEFLTRTGGADSNDFWTVGISESNGVVSLHFDRHPDASYLVEYSPDLVAWFPWPVPGNAPLYTTAMGAAAVSGPAEGNRLYFRMRVMGH